jgi:hypothetical protein
MSELSLKSISNDAVASALDKARWYRALNEPLEAESICRDVLAVDPENQTALATLLLSLSDQFVDGLGGRFRQAKELVGQLTIEYEREYFTGILCERRAKCQYRKGTPGCGHLAYPGLRSAMEHYERAQELSSEGNDDAVLRWNTCARIIDANPDIEPEPASQSDPVELE